MLAQVFSVVLHLVQPAAGGAEGISGIARFRAAYSPSCDVEIITRRAAAPGDGFTPEMLETIRAIPGVEAFVDTATDRTLYTVFRQVHTRERSGRSCASTISLLQGGNAENHAQIGIWSADEYARVNIAQNRCELREIPPSTWEAYVKHRDSGMLPPELERAQSGFLELTFFLIWALDQAGVVESRSDGRIRLSTPSGDILVLIDEKTGELMEASVNALGEMRWVFTGFHASPLFPARCPREIRETYTPIGSPSVPGDVILVDSARCISSVNPTIFDWRSLVATAIQLPSGRVIDSSGAVIAHEPPDRSPPPIVHGKDGSLEVASGSIAATWAWGVMIAITAVAIIIGLVLRRRMA